MTMSQKPLDRFGRIDRKPPEEQLQVDLRNPAVLASAFDRIDNDCSLGSAEFHRCFLGFVFGSRKGLRNLIAQICHIDSLILKLRKSSQLFLENFDFLNGRHAVFQVFTFLQPFRYHS